MGLHHAYVTPHGLSDLDRLARRHDLDYVRIARRARRHRLEVPVGEVLRILVRRFGTPMPDEFIKALRPRAGGRLAAKAYRKVLSQDRAVHGWGVLLELLFRGSLLDRWRLMRSYVWPGREVIIRRYQLSPDISAWCYHTLRPLRLMRRTRRILSELLHGSAG